MESSSKKKKSAWEIWLWKFFFQPLYKPEWQESDLSSSNEGKIDLLQFFSSTEVNDSLTSAFD